MNRFLKASQKYNMSLFLIIHIIVFLDNKSSAILTGRLISKYFLQRMYYLSVADYLNAHLIVICDKLSWGRWILLSSGQKG